MCIGFVIFFFLFLCTSVSFPSFFPSFFQFSSFEHMWDSKQQREKSQTKQGLWPSRCMVKEDMSDYRGTYGFKDTTNQAPQAALISLRAHLRSQRVCVFCQYSSDLTQSHSQHRLPVSCLLTVLPAPWILMMKVSPEITGCQGSEVSRL